MEYLAFALKYRPKNFDEVIGQSHIVTALKKAVATNRVHHAYLFSGPRGVGKTSLARILAKSLNCFEGPTAEPCGQCLSCQEITKGTSLDVIEIDGASNRGIDDIRTLRENVKLSPAYSRYKIYIIDEVHQITPDGFNALLKTLEEPPSHVKFIFATTHPQKVLPTILSRCQKFQFNLLPAEKIVEKLRKIVTAEKLEVDDSLLYIIARSSGGSIRDAESLLDQFVPTIIEKKSPYDIISFLGIIDEESLNTMVKLIIEKNLSATLDFVNKLIQDGKDLGIFLNNLIEHFRNLILVKLSPATFKDLIYVSPQTKEFLYKQSELIPVSEVLKMIDLLIEAKDLSKKLNSVRIPFELVLIKFCYHGEEKPPSTFKPSLNKNINKPESTSDAVSLDLEEFDWEEETNDPPPPVEKAKVTTEVEDREPINLSEVKQNWRTALAELKKTKVSLASYLSEATIVSLEGRALKLVFPKEFAFHKEIVEKKTNLTFLEQFLTRFFNKDLRLKFVLSSGGSSRPDNVSSQTVNNKKDEETKLINDLLDTFEGTLDV